MKSVSKSFILLVFITASFITTSCDKVAELFKADINLSDTISFVIPRTQLRSFDTTKTVQFNVDSFIRASTNNNADLSNLKSVKLKAATLTLMGSPDQNFGLFKQVQLSVKTNQNSSPYTLLVSDFSNVTNVLAIPVNSNDDLKSYFNATSFIYTLSAELKDSVAEITQEIPCDLIIEYTLSVQK